MKFLTDILIGERKNRDNFLKVLHIGDVHPTKIYDDGINFLIEHSFLGTPITITIEVDKSNELIAGLSVAIADYLYKKINGNIDGSEIMTILDDLCLSKINPYTLKYKILNYGMSQYNRGKTDKLNEIKNMLNQ